MKPIRNKFEFDPRDLSEKYADAILTTKEATGEQVIQVHRVFLAALSNKFESLFDESKSRHELIVVRNMSFEILSDIIKFLYTGKAVLADKAKEYIEDFRDGLNMLKIDISEKADSRISEELKEVRSRNSGQRPPGADVKVASSNVVKKPFNSDGNKSGSSEDINANRKRSHEQLKYIRSKKIKEERASDDDESSVQDEDVSADPRKMFASSVKLGDGARSEFDLRGKLVGNKIRQIRHSLEGGKRSVSQSLERSMERLPERGRQRLSERSVERLSKRSMERPVPERYAERQISERSMERGVSERKVAGQDPSYEYCFDPKRPRADPNWEPELQVNFSVYFGVTVLACSSFFGMNSSPQPMSRAE